MANDLTLSVGADLGDLEDKLKEACQMVASFSAGLTLLSDASLAAVAAAAAETARAITAISAASDAAGKSTAEAGKTSGKSWNGIANGIESSLNRAIFGVLRGTTSLKAGLDQVAVSIEQRFLDLALRVPEDWASGQLKMLLSSQAAEAQKNAAAAAGTAQREALGADENAGLLRRIAEAVAQWLGFETDKTAASASGSSLRLSADASANATARPHPAPRAWPTSAAGAAVAAAAAMASVAAIPVTGWAMAPAVGAQTYTAALLYAGLASAAGGWDQVPADGTLAQLHKDEMVLPATIATPLRAALASGWVRAAAAGGQGAGGQGAVGQGAIGQGAIGQGAIGQGAGDGGITAGGVAAPPSGLAPAWRAPVPAVRFTLPDFAPITALPGAEGPAAGWGASGANPARSPPSNNPIHLHANFTGPVNGADPQAIGQMVLSTLNNAAANGVSPQYPQLQRMLKRGR